MGVKAAASVLRRDLDLAALAVESHGSAGQGKAQGLTEVEQEMTFRTLTKRTVNRGRTCIWFDEVRVDLAITSLQIFVPREYPEDSCEYLAVLAHEHDHERVYLERLQAAAEEIKNALASAKWLPARGNPLETADGDGAEALLGAKIRKIANPIYERYKEDLGVAQAELDRPDLYQWYSKRCGGWK